MHDPFQQAQPPAGQPPAGQPLGYDPRPGAPGQPYGVAPLVEEDGWGKIGVIMVALAVVFAGGVAFFILTSGGAKKDEAAAAALNAAVDDGGAGAPASDDAGAAAFIANADAGAAVAETDPAAASEFDGGSSETEPKADPSLDPSADVGGAIGLLRENGEVDRPAGLVSLAIESEPSGATVIRKRDGVRLGMTPYRYETEASSGDVSFVLKLDGYRSMSVSMPGNHDGVRQVMLLPGKGGVPIPESQPGSSEPAPKAPIAAKSPAAKSPSKSPAKSPVRKPKRPSKPKTASKPKPPKKPKKPKAGKVDYNADPIPL